MVAGGAGQMEHVWAQMMAEQQSFTQPPPVSAELAGRVPSVWAPGRPRGARPAWSSLPSCMVPTFIQTQQAGRTEAPIRSVRHFSVSQLSLTFLKELPPTRLHAAAQLSPESWPREKCKNPQEGNCPSAGRAQHLRA